MTTAGSDHERRKELFARLEPLSAAERRALLESEVADDPALQRDLEGLLHASDGAESAVFEPFVAAPTDGPRRDPEMPERIGPYRVTGLLGRGGMACVFRAEQDQPIRRTVALKVVRPGFDAESVLGRFESERQALARLQHRNVATVLDAGADPFGPSWFAMELVDGPPITTYGTEHGLDLAARLRLFVQVCRGVQHAHVRGILHRDLKPSNVLVAIEDGDAVPKIIDFGVAKALGADSPLAAQQHTLDTQIVGTLEYMSPEQARIGNPDVDARSDVYALGVLLYELLTGRVPIGGDAFTNAALDTVQSLIQTAKPAAPSQAAAGATGVTGVRVPADFDCVVLKALEKDPCARYATAKEFADDVERFLEGRPLAVRPPTRLYVLRTFTRRHRTLVAFAAAITVAVVAGLVGTTIGLVKAVHRGSELEAALTREREQEARLRRLVDFQSAQLGAIDLAQLGLTIRDGLVAADAPDGDTVALDGSLVETDFTEIARSSVARSLLIGTAETAEQELADDPALLAGFLQSVADAAGELGLFADGLPVQERAIELRRAHFGDEAPETLASQVAMAGLLLGAGRPSDAAQLAVATRGTLGRVVGPDAASTLDADEMVARVREAEGDASTAEAAYRTLAERRAAVLGPEDPATLRALARLASTLSSQSRFDEAVEVLRGVLAVRLDVLGPAHIEVATTRHNLGSALYRLGALEDGRREVEAALDVFMTTLGSAHPRTLIGRSSLSVILRSLGRDAEAIAENRLILDAQRDSLGPEHPDTVRTIANLGAMLATAGQFEEALVLTEQAYAIRLRRLGPEHRETLMSANTVGMAAAALRSYDDAERYYRLAYDGRRAVLGPDHLDTLVSLRNLIGVLVTLDRSEEAAPLADQLVAGGAARLPDGHWMQAVFALERGRVRTAIAAYAGAESDLLGAHDRLTATRAPGDRFTVSACELLAELYDAWHVAEPEAGHDASAARWRAMDEGATPATHDAQGT